MSDDIAASVARESTPKQRISSSSSVVGATRPASTAICAAQRALQGLGRTTALLAIGAETGAGIAGARGRLAGGGGAATADVLVVVRYERKKKDVITSRDSTKSCVDDRVGGAVPHETRATYLQGCNVCSSMGCSDGVPGSSSVLSRGECRAGVQGGHRHPDCGVTGHPDCGSIGYAVRARATAFSNIVVGPGVYPERNISISVPLSVYGTPGSTTVDCGGSGGSGFIVSAASATFSGLSVTNCLGASGGITMVGYFGPPSLTIVGCNFLSCSTAPTAGSCGGGVSVSGGRSWVGAMSIVITNSTFVNCTSVCGGGLCVAMSGVDSAVGSQVLVSGCQFVENAALGGAGGGVLVLFDGPMSWDRTNISIVNSSFVGNFASTGGGGSWVELYNTTTWSRLSMSVSLSSYSQNTAISMAGGSGVHIMHGEINASQFSWEDSSFVGNTVAAGWGGGAMARVWNAAVTQMSLRWTRCMFIGNSVQSVPGTQWDGGGTGVWWQFAYSTIIGLDAVTAHSSFVNNVAHDSGAGAVKVLFHLHGDHTPATSMIYNNVTILYIGCLFDANSGTGAALNGDGGAVQHAHYGGNWTHGRLSWIDCVFRGNSARLGGGISYLQSAYATLRQCSLVVRACTFANNSAIEGGGGIGIYLYPDVATVNFVVSINITSFTGNVAGGGSGGAVYVSATRLLGSVAVRGSRFTANSARSQGGALGISIAGLDAADTARCKSLVPAPPVWQYEMTGSIDDSVFENNAANVGGGVAVENGNWILTDVALHSNAANVYGGGLYVSGGSASVTLSDTVFVRNVAKSSGGELLSLAYGSVVVAYGTSFELQVFGGSDEIAVPIGGGLAWSAASDVRCPRGALIQFPLNVSDMVMDLAAWCTVGPAFLCGLRVLCENCPNGTYTLSGGSVSGMAASTVQNPACLTCPFGAVCENGGVVSQGAYWGAVSGSVVSFVRCPDGYCCTAAACSSYDECARGRHGVLCGECDTGSGEAFFSASCVPADACTGAAWAIPVLLLYSCLYGAYFVYRGGRTKGARGALGDADKLVMFYLQMCVLVSSSTSAAKALGWVDAIVGILALSPSGEHHSWRAGVCIAPGMSALTKLGAGYVPPLLVFAFVCVASGVKKTWSSDALVLVCLYSYSQVLKTTASLLDCISVPGHDHQRLFLSGSVVCWSEAWQWILLPIIVTLSLAPIGVAWKLWRYRVRRQAPSLLLILSKRYREEAYSWECVLAGHRVTLVMLNTFLGSEPLWRQASGSLVCVAALWAHASARPFHADGLNRLQTLLLGSLCVLAVCGMSDATLSSYGIVGSPARPLWLQHYEYVSVVVHVFFVALPPAVLACAHVREWISYSPLAFVGRCGVENLFGRCCGGRGKVAAAYDIATPLLELSSDDRT